MKNILQQFELTCQKFPEKDLFREVERSISFCAFKTLCQKVASAIAKHDLFGQPVAVIDNRDINTLVAMFAVVYSGNHYVLLDGASPNERLDKICNVVQPKILLCQSKQFEKAAELDITRQGCQILDIEKLQESEIDEPRLKQIREKCTECDPVYILFTSGSTGTPKGTVITHRNLLSYIYWFSSTFDIDEKTVFASQTPFYFSASVSDLYSSLCYGATFNIIPKSYFTFPIQLVRFMNERKVNTIYWVPSALCIVANVDLFKYEKPLYLQKVMFAGEIMPNKQLNYWRKWLPDVKFANLFGPTETTDICTYYKVDRPFDDDQRLPIGKHCENLDTFIVDESGKEVTSVGVQGQLYVRGPFVALGYYKNPEQTAKAFVQNPLQSLYPEIVYRTGDIVMLNEYGEYEYIGRTDFQIKHKGYRIELGEIERVCGALEGVSSDVALYDKQEDKIVLIFTGKQKEETLFGLLVDKLPSYMLPETVIKVATLPFNANGKIDRKFLQENYKSLSRR